MQIVFQFIVEANRVHEQGLQKRMRVSEGYGYAVVIMRSRPLSELITCSSIRSHTSSVYLVELFGELGEVRGG